MKLNKILIIGFGHIGKYHLRSLDLINQFEVVAVCDIERETRKSLSPDVKFSISLDDLMLEQNLFDCVIIATPPRTHLGILKKLISIEVPIIIEKPLAVSFAETKEIFDLVSDSNVNLYSALHAARALEVEWIQEYLSANVSLLGPITGFHSSFFDPYLKDSEVIGPAIGLENSWLDSGVNALSVLGEFIDLDLIKCTDFHSIESDRKKIIIRAIATYQFESSNGGWGSGVIHTEWTDCVNHKATRLFFGETGHQVILDHTLQSVVLIDKTGKATLLKQFEGDRLLNHYVNLFKDYLNCHDRGKFNGDKAFLVHKKLFEAVE